MVVGREGSKGDWNILVEEEYSPVREQMALECEECRRFLIAGVKLIRITVHIMVQLHISPLHHEYIVQGENTDLGGILRVWHEVRHQRGDIPSHSGVRDRAKAAQIQEPRGGCCDDVT